MNEPAPGDPAFRCAAASRLRAEPIAGTASTVRAFLLIEETGPWGVEALRDARLPDGAGPRIREAARAAGVRPLLMRRPNRSDAGARRVVAAYAHPHTPWLETGSVDDLHELLDLDLAGLRAGRSVGLARDPDPVFGVCTHGRHDACCAERGRPAAAALEASYREHAWEVSHLGGDRFAGNMLVLPHGLYYGRVDARAATRIAAAHLGGELDLDHLRGRSGLAMPVQFAEIALRRELGLVRHHDVRFVDGTREGNVTTARFAVATSTAPVADPGSSAVEAGSSMAEPVETVVRVRTWRGEATRLTCGAERDDVPLVHEVLAIRVAE